MDLVGRKTLAMKGEPLKVLLQEMREFEAGLGDHVAQYGELNMRSAFLSACDELEQSTEFLIENAQNDLGLAGAAAVDYQNMLGYLCYAYMWLRIEAATAVSEANYDAAYIAGKRAAARYFYEKRLPILAMLRQRICAGSASLMEIDVSSF
jgi:hypothetical protein